MTITKEEREDWRREAKETIELNADWEIRVTRLLDALKAAESHAAEMERQRDRLIDKLEDISDKVNRAVNPLHVCSACGICPIDDSEIEGRTCGVAIQKWAAQRRGL